MRRIRMMEQIFIKVLNMSLTGSMIILIVLFLRLCLKKAPKLFSYCLWAVVLFRLLCPVSFSAAFSVFSILSVPSAAFQNGVSISQTFPVHMAEGEDDFFIRQTPPAGDIHSQASRSVTDAVRKAPAFGRFFADKRLADKWLLTAGTYLWLCGISVLGLHSLSKIIKLKRMIKFASWDKENIYLTQALPAPFVMGVIHPKIYLPQNLGAEEKSYILLHEQIHIKRKDHILKILGFFALCLHWFNPLAWAAFFLSEKDMEMSCDEAVIRNIGSHVKKDYSSSLLSLSAGTFAAPTVTATPLAFGENDIASRIKNILGYQKPAAGIVKIAALFCGITAIILLANPKEPNDAKNQMQANKQTDVSNQSDMQNQTLPPSGTATQAQKNASDDAGSHSLAAQIHLTDFEKQLLPDGAAQTDRIFYAVNIRSIARSARVIDAFIKPDDAFPFEEEESIPFSENCQFFINESMNQIDYKEVTFSQFANAVSQGGYYLPKYCLLGLKHGQADCAVLKNAYEPFGIDTMKPLSDSSMYDSYLKSARPDSFAADFRLIAKETMDISDHAGNETIEVYADQVDNVIVFFQSAENQTLYMQDASLSRAGWSNIYLGEDQGIPYILHVGIEDRFNYGSFDYQVYRLDEEGRPLIAASSCFSFYFNSNSSLIYNDDLFRSWILPMEHYLQNSRLLVSTQDGEIRTKQVSDADRYNYQTLNRMDRALELNESSGSLIRFHNSWYNRQSLSQETLEWLEWYNRLSASEQSAVSAVPNDLYDGLFGAATADAAAER